MKLSAVLFGVAVLLSALASARQAPGIQGYVLDSGGKPIQSVSVKVWEGKDPGKSAVTDAAGFYNVPFGSGQPISWVEFTHTDYDSGEEVHLSERRAHTVSKVLYRPGQQRSFAAKLEAINVLRSSALFALNNPDQRATIITEVNRLGIASKLEKMPIDTEGTTSPAGVQALETQRRQTLELFRGVR